MSNLDLEFEPLEEVLVEETGEVEEADLGHFTDNGEDAAE